MQTLPARYIDRTVLSAARGRRDEPGGAAKVPDLMETLLAFEQAGWEALSGALPGPRAFYDRVLTDDAIMIVPGMVLDRAAALDSWDGIPPWAEYDLADPHTVGLGPDAAALTYHATARRDSQAEPYRAVMTSVYVRGASGWQLAIHQQTPLR
jgi:hypothetical protein